jgi:hypothetical protein
MVMKTPSIAMLLAPLGACSSAAPALPEGGAVPPVAASVAYLSPTEHLVRASMALRGLRPSSEDMRAVSDDAGALPQIVDRYLASDEFGETVRDLHNEALLVRARIAVGEVAFRAVGALAGHDEFELNTDVEEAPLRLIEHVVMNDRPYTEIVTAAYTFANDTVATVWGLSPSAQGEGAGWREMQFADGRPAAGLLSDPMVFLRHKSTPSNSNRGRANAISRALLCYDFGSRDVVIDGKIDLSDPAAVADAVAKNQACAGCHQTLDPLASFFFGHLIAFAPGLTTEFPTTPGGPLKLCGPPDGRACGTVQPYDPSTERDWQTSTKRPPEYFGLGGGRLDDLGRQIAADPRFSLCAVKRFYAYLTGSELDALPFETAARLQRRFIDGGFRARTLARDVVLSDEFRASHPLTDDAAEQAPGLALSRPRQLRRLFADLTGYRWEATGEFLGLPASRIDLLGDSLIGFESLGGGMDSYYAVRPAPALSPTASLVLRALSARAAGYAVETDLEDPDLGHRRLLGSIADANDTDEDHVRAQLADLHVRILGELVTANSPEVDESTDLFFATLDRTHDARHAWKATITGMLQDPRVLLY